MQIYHFCCERDMRGIRSKGITEGMIFLQLHERKSGKDAYRNVLYPGWQWLTLDGNRNNQSWATQHTIRTNRTEYRWTVEIPENEECQLYDRDQLVELYPEAKSLFDNWPGSENWRVFRGNITKYWLKKLERWNKESGTWEEVSRGR